MADLESVIRVGGMDCGEEVSAVQDALHSISGVVSVRADLLSSRVSIVHEPAITLETLKGRIRSIGLSVNDDNSAEDAPAVRKSSIAWVSVAGICLLLGWILSKAGASALILSTVSYLLAVAAGAVLVLPKALRSLGQKRLDMNALMCLAAIGAIILKEYLEGAAVVFLFALAELLESYSIDRARRSIRSLLTLTPEKATLRQGDEWVDALTEDVKVGDRVLVRSGEKIPLDGIVVTGTSSVNQAPITGESLPVLKEKGGSVLAGTLNQDGSLEIEVTKLSKDSKLAQIIHLIENAQKQKAPTQRFVDRFAEIYTPIVVLLAVVVAIAPPLFMGAEWSLWFYRALVLLVVACPCALVIATPVSVVSGLTAMARRGVLIKGGAALEALGSLRALAVDKTGTITVGRPSVRMVIGANGKTENEILSVAASIDFHSTHPLAYAVTEAAKSRGIDIPASQNYRSISGRGAEAQIKGVWYFLGNHRFAHERGACSPELELEIEKLEAQAVSVVVVARNQTEGAGPEAFGILGVGDEIRADARHAVKLLHEAGLDSVVMLSGDNSRTARAIAKEVGIDEAYGDLLPEDKVAKIKEIRDRFRSVAMIGDGVNDAPAMAAATLGIAMGASGTDTAIETADVALMQDRLSGVAEAIRMGRRTMRVIRFNTAFALGTKMVFLVLSVLGVTGLWLAIAADTGATLIVIANALRLVRVKEAPAYLEKIEQSKNDTP
jgi:Zn2+/Cd2+-exporting ATPase